MRLKRIYPHELLFMISSAAIKSTASAGLTVSNSPAVNIARVFALGALTVTILTIPSTLKLPLDWGCKICLLTFAILLSFPAGLGILKATSAFRGRKVAEELRYFVISESVIAEAHPNLIDDLASYSSLSSLFPALVKEGRLISLLRNFFTVHETVRIYCRWIRSDEVKALLNDYLFSISIGSVKEWLQIRGRELFERIRGITKETVNRRLTIAVIVAVILGYTPPLIIALTPLTGPQYVNKLLGSLMLSLPIAFAALPKLPHHMRIRAGTKLRVVAVLGGISLQTAGVLIIPNEVPNLIIASSLIFLAGGTYSTIQWIKGLSEISGLNRILSKLYEIPLSRSGRVEVLKDIIVTQGGKGWREIARSFTNLNTLKHESLLRAWISRFALYVIKSGIRYGSLSRESILKLSELISTSLQDLRESLLTSSVIAGIALALPYLMIIMKNLAGSMPSLINYYIVFASLGYSLFTSYVLFGDPMNTLLPGITSLELYLGVRS